MTFYDFIAEKGHKPLSLALGVSEATTYSWAARRSIPRTRWDDLMRLYPKLTYTQLRDMEIASKVSQGA